MRKPGLRTVIINSNNNDTSLLFGGLFFLPPRWKRSFAIYVIHDKFLKEKNNRNRILFIHLSMHSTIWAPTMHQARNMMETTAPAHRELPCYQGARGAACLVFVLRWVTRVLVKGGNSTERKQSDFHVPRELQADTESPVTSARACHLKTEWPRQLSLQINTSLVIL